MSRKKGLAVNVGNPPQTVYRCSECRDAYVLTNLTLTSMVGYRGTLVDLTSGRRMSVTDLRDGCFDEHLRPARTLTQAELAAYWRRFKAAPPIPVRRKVNPAGEGVARKTSVAY